MKRSGARAWKLAAVVATTLVFVALGAIQAFAQSSGSFNFNYDETACTDVGGQLGGGTTHTLLNTTMKVSSGNGVALVIRPSAVTGLLTNASMSGKLGGGISTGSAQAGVTFSVAVTPLSGQAKPTVIPSAPVTYDDRFLQISTNLFNTLANCTDLAPCTFDVNQTTLSAHSYDYVITGLSSGNYGVTVSWSTNTTATLPSSALACVGPVVITTEQVKIFQQNTGISF